MHPRIAIMPLDNALEASTAERPSNKHYKSEVKQTVLYPRLFLGLLGVWPMLSTDLSPAKKYAFVLLIVVSLILFSFVIIPPAVHGIMLEKDTSLRLEIFGSVSYHLTNLIKYVFFLLRIKTIRQCVEHVETDWKSIVSEQDRAIMKSNTSVGRSQALTCCILLWPNAIAYHAIAPIIQGKTMNEMNVTVRTLVYPGFDIFFDYQLQPTYAILFLTICASAFVSFNVTCASYSFTAGFVSHACGMLQIVISRLEVLSDCMEIHTNDYRLQNEQSLIMQYHIRVLRLSSRIEQVVREICFMEVVSSFMIMCCYEYYVITERSSTERRVANYMISLFMCTFNIWLLCYIGELLKDQGRRVGEAAYMIEWYKLPCKSSKKLIMMMIISNTNPPEITAGSIFELSMRSFGALLRTSLTYCNMLRTLTA